MLRTRLKIKKPHKSEATRLELRGSKGSTMLLGLLLVAILVSSTYILGRTAIRNLNRINVVSQGEMTILTAEAGLEQGLWAHIRKKDLYVGNCDNGANYKHVTINSTLTAGNCRSYLYPTDAIFVFDHGVTSEMYLIDPADPDKDGQYAGIVFKLNSGSADIKICNWDESICQNYSHNSSTLSVTNLLTTERYIITIQPGTNNYEANIFGLDASGNPKGLPADFVTVEGTGEGAQTTTRTLQIQVLP